MTPSPRRRTLRPLLAKLVVLGCLAATLPVLSWSGSRPPVPATPPGLPRGIEDLPAYVRAASCDPAAKPGSVALGRLLVDTYPGTSYGISRDCGVESIFSEHYEGRAVDWMVSAASSTGRARAEAFLRWLLATDRAGHPYANARRLGVMYAIWDRRILGFYDNPPRWKPYRCSGVTGCHQDHVHLSLTWAGALGHTSFWTGRVAAQDYGPCRPADLAWAPVYRRPNPVRCPRYPVVRSAAGGLAGRLGRFSGAQVEPGSSGPVVATIQAALRVAADGGYGPGTARAVRAFQATHRLRADGVVGQGTWRALLGRGAASAAPAVPVPVASPLTRYRTTVLQLGSRGPAVVAVQRELRLTADGAFGPQTRAGVRGYQRRHRLPVTGTVGPRTWDALLAGAAPGRPAGPLTRYRGLVLRTGSRGPAVRALQAVLRVAADGEFGPRTRAAVRGAQARLGLKVTGVVAEATWRGLGA